MVLGMVLGDKMELYLWLSYTRYGFDWLMRPMVMVLILLLVVSVAYPLLGKWREKKLAEEQLVEV
jgi:TctA family transporter